MQPALDALLGILDLEKIEENVFRGRSPQEDAQRVFGGQVAGQALVAAGRTVGERHVHSLHAYFLRPGDPRVPILYEVDRLRDGRSFTTRRVTAVQHGRAIFALAASFHREERGLEHRAGMPDVPPPESLPTWREAMRPWLPKLPPDTRRWVERDRAIDTRHTAPFDPVTPEKTDPVQCVWMRADGHLPDDPLLHACVVAYASDMTLLDAAMLPHGIGWTEEGIQVASLDHAMWFHRPVRADDWLLYAQESPAMAGARAFCTANLFRRDGEVMVSVAQEGLVRPARPA